MRGAAALGWLLAGLGQLAPPPQAAPPPPARPAFDADRHPPAPDYAAAASWAVRPGAPGASVATPPNTALPRSAAGGPVDVFYVHPTTYRAGDHWNADVADADTNDWTDTSVVARQASLFNACCRIYAPRYRQAGTGAVTSQNGDGEKAYDLAYQDVRRAFRSYLARDNGGRPFILAGHSQGTLLIYRLIEEEVDGKPLAARMVAAYAVGVGVSQGDFGRTYRTVTPCTRAAQTGCIVSWNSFARDGDAAPYLRRAESRFTRRHPGAPDATLLCVNPLTFDARLAAAAPDRARGALPGEPGPDAPRGATLPPLVPHAVGASCEDGVLRIDASPDAGLSLKPLPGGSLHLKDYDLFYEDVRRNVAVRVAAYLAAHPRAVSSGSR